MLNQETQMESEIKHKNHSNHNPLNDHDYCSPNKILKQQPKTKHDDLNNSPSSSSLSSSDGSTKDLMIAHDLPYGSHPKSSAPKDAPSVSQANSRNKLDNDEGISNHSAANQARARRPRQSTSVTDKSEWITGDDQIDSVLSEHLNEPIRDKRQRIPKELDSAFSAGTSSDYSSSDGDSHQDSEYNSEDDPDRLWCICQKPHGGKFMICCDICKDWFHGHCVGVTKLMGDRFEKQGKEWFCGECLEKLRSGTPRNAIPKKTVKKEKTKKRASIPGKRGRGRPKKSESSAQDTPIRASLRNTRKSSSSLDPKLGVDNARLKKNLARSDARSESYSAFEDDERLRELIRERKRAFFFKRSLAEQQKAAKRHELGLGRQSLTALSDSLDSLASSTSTPNMNNLPITATTKNEFKEEPKEPKRSKPNIVLQINTKRESNADLNDPNSRIVTAIVRSPKKSKHSEPSDPVANDLFAADPIQVSKKVKSDSTYTNPTGSDISASNGDMKARKSSTSSGSTAIPAATTSTTINTTQKHDKSMSSESGDQTPKKKRKDSESSSLNGSLTHFGSKYIVQKIKDSLEARSKQIKDLEVSSNQIEKLAADIERQLNECFKEGTQKYLTKFRSLVFNLRDIKNQNLVKNVLTGEIPPDRLVRLSPEEMASQELAKWREMENKHSIELIKRDAQLAAQQVIVKKTHKGEEVISAPQFNEPDDTTAVVDSQEAPATPTKATPVIKESIPESSSSVSPTIIGATTKPVGPLKMKISVTSSEITPKIASLIQENMRDDSSHHDSIDHGDLRDSMDYSDHDDQQEYFDHEYHSDQHDSSASLYEFRNEPVWSGTITMPDIPKFSALAKPVSGCVEFMRDEVNKHLIVCGRIAPDQIQSYIKKLKSTTKNQILMIQLHPLTADDKSNFNNFFDHLYSRNRCGVIQTNPQSLKDFYIIPIHENSQIPEVFKPIKGPGLDRQVPNCLLGLLVRSKRTANTSAQLPTYTPTPIE